MFFAFEQINRSEEELVALLCLPDFLITVSVMRLQMNLHLSGLQDRLSGCSYVVHICTLLKNAQQL